jgi:hypothetical protein
MIPGMDGNADYSEAMSPASDTLTVTSVSADTIPPNTTILTGPDPLIKVASAKFTWTGSDNVTLTSALVYSYQLDSDGWSQYSLATEVTLTDFSEGSHTFYVRAKDEAGNVDASPASYPLGLDMTAPVVKITAPTPGYYQTATLPGLAYTVDDMEATVTVTGWATTEGEHTVTVTATDAAGNVGSASVTYTVDNTPPRITVKAATNADGSPYAEGTWTNQTVTVHFAAVDDLSGIEEGQDTFEVSFPNEGANQSATHTFTDRAGNGADATFGPINIDKTPPEFGNCPAGGPFILNSGDQSTQPVGPITVDASISGLNEGASTLRGTVDTSSVGSKDVEFTAVDNAGNRADKTCSYSVIYDFYGFFPPIDISGKGLFKLGSTIPVKFQLKDANGNLVTTAKATVQVEKISEADGTPIDDPKYIDATPTGGTEFRYDNTAGQYIYNLSTKLLSAGTWFIQVSLDDGTFHTAKVVLRK